MSDKNNEKSKVPSFVVGVVAIVVTLAVCVCVLTFLTNGVIEVDADEATTKAHFDRTTVTTIIEEIRQNEEEPPKEEEERPGNRVAFFGDSITTFTGQTNFNNMYPSGDVTTSSDTWWMQVVNRGGFEYAGNSSSSGSYVTNKGSYHANSQERIDALPDDADRVYVFMGMNDYWDSADISTFKTAYATMLNNIKVKLPDATIICLLLYKTDFEQGRTSNLVTDYNDAIKECASNEGCGIVDLNDLTMTDDSMTIETDVHVHPTLKGMTAIADKVLGNTPVSKPDEDDDDEEPLPGIPPEPTPEPAEPEETPNCSIDFKNKQLTGLEPGADYTINGTAISADKNGNILIQDSWIGQNLSIIKVGDGTNTKDSDPQDISIPSRPAAPTGVSTTHETASNANDGTITGVSADMEYSSGTSTYKDCSAGTVTGLSPGTYLVRYKATDSEFASESASVAIKPYAQPQGIGLVCKGMGWYEDIASSTPQTDINNPVGRLGDIPVYTGLPWAPDAGCYAYYQFRAKEEIYDLYEQAGIPRGQYSSFVINSNQASLPANGGVIDGVQCMGVSTVPSALDRNYYPGKAASQAAASGDSSALNGNLRMALILVPKGQDKENPNNYLFVPCVKQDAKGHTFYGGVAQTNCKVAGDHQIQIATNNSGSQHQDITLEQNFDPISVLQTIEGIMNKGGLSMGAWYKNEIETYWLSQDTQDALRNNYDLVGWVIWPTYIN